MKYNVQRSTTLPLGISSRDEGDVFSLVYDLSSMYNRKKNEVHSSGSSWRVNEWTLE
jgi:hypothetical protein